MVRIYQYSKEQTCDKKDNIIKVRVTREWRPRNLDTNHILNNSYIIMNEQVSDIYIQKTYANF